MGKSCCCHANHGSRSPIVVIINQAAPLRRERPFIPGAGTNIRIDLSGVIDAPAIDYGIGLGQTLVLTQTAPIIVPGTVTGGTVFIDFVFTEPGPPVTLSMQLFARGVSDIQPRFLGSSDGDFINGSSTIINVFPGVDVFSDTEFVLLVRSMGAGPITGNIITSVRVPTSFVNIV